MPFSMEATLSHIAVLNQKLESIVEPPIDMSDPDWQEKMRKWPKPLDEVGIRLEAEELLESILEAYAGGDAELRTAIRQMLYKHRAFSGATGVVVPPTTRHGFRQHLLRLSAVDHVYDFRDAALELNDLCEAAQAASVDIGPVLREVSELSSDVPQSYMPSLKAMMYNASQHAMR